MPVVSIVTTCFNAEGCIRKTIESVLSQTFRNFEYIIKDGGSTDATMKIAASYAPEFEKRHIPYYYYTQKDSGIYDGMNHGVGYCHGTFINFMNADDFFFDDSVLSRIFENHDFSDTDVIYGDAVEYECGQYYRYQKDFGRIERSMPFSHQSVFARRTLLLEYPFVTDYRIGADYDFLLTAFQKGARFKDCDVTICVVSRDGVSSVDLYHTFVETVAIQERHGIRRFTEKQYKKKLFFLKIKQFVLLHFPHAVVSFIRRIQRAVRKQNEVVNLCDNRYRNEADHEKN